MLPDALSKKSPCFCTYSHEVAKCVDSLDLSTNRNKSPNFDQKKSTRAAFKNTKSGAKSQVLKAIKSSLKGSFARGVDDQRVTSCSE